jgi:hypothetical protein
MTRNLSREIWQYEGGGGQDSLYEDGGAGPLLAD